MPARPTGTGWIPFTTAFVIASSRISAVISDGYAPIRTCLIMSFGATEDGWLSGKGSVRPTYHNTFVTIMRKEADACKHTRSNSVDAYRNSLQSQLRRKKFGKVGRGGLATVVCKLLIILPK